MNRQLLSAAFAALFGVALFSVAGWANQPGAEQKSPADATQKAAVQKVAPVQKEAPTQKVAPVQKATPVQGPTQKVAAPTQKSPVQKTACDDCGGGRRHRRRGC